MASETPYVTIRNPEEDSPKEVSEEASRRKLRSTYPVLSKATDQAAQWIQEVPSQVQELADYRAAGDNTCYFWCSLVGEFLLRKLYILFEIWVVTCGVFYTDIVLDIKMMTVFYEYGDYKFIIASVTGMYIGVWYAMVDMQAAIKGAPALITLVSGFLLPFHLHILFLSVYSTYNGRIHPMLSCSKFAESVIEATVSAGIQTYAVIFRDYDWKDLYTNYLSVCLSYLSIAFALTQFDHRSRGLRGLVGASKGWTFKLCLVFVFRLCEIVSRLSTVGLFQLAVRNEDVFDGYGFGVYGGWSVFMVDLVVMSAIICREGNSLMLAIPSTIVWMNPVLIKPNCFTMGAPVYYTVRLVELGIMLAIACKSAVFHGGHGRFDHFDAAPSNNVIGFQSFQFEFYNDILVIWTAIASTAGMLALLLILRLGYSDHVIQLDWTLFLDSTMDDKWIAFEKDDLERFESKAEGLIAEAALRLASSLAVQQNQTRQARKLEDADDDDDTADPPFTTSMSQTMISREVASSCPTISSWLLRWLEKEVAFENHAKRANNKSNDLFLQSVRVGYNLNMWLKGDSLRKRHFHLEYLQVVNSAQQDAEVRISFGDCRQMLANLMPQWYPIDQGSFYTSGLYLRLFQQKCDFFRMVTKCLLIDQGKSFLTLDGCGFEIIRAFRPLSTVELIRYVPLGPYPSLPGCPHMPNWLIQMQTHALLEFLHGVRDIQAIRKVVNELPKGIFRDAADKLLEVHQQSISGVLRSSEQNSCASALKLMIKSVKVDLTLKMDDDKLWQFFNNFSLLATPGETLKLTNVSLENHIDHSRDFEEHISELSQVQTLFRTSYDGDYDIDFESTTITFTFVRNNEIEPLSIYTIQSLGSWPMYKTSLLQFIHVFSAKCLEKEGTTAEMFEDFVELEDRIDKVRSMVQEKALAALREQAERVIAFGEDTVNPNTAKFEMAKYREKKESSAGATAKQVRDGKSQSQSALLAYEDVLDKIMESLRAMKSDRNKFGWSTRVCEEIDHVNIRLKKYLQNLRRIKDQYWNKEEGLLTQSEVQRRKEAEKYAAENRKRGLEMAEQAEQERAKAKEIENQLHKKIEEMDHEHQLEKDELNRKIEKLLQNQAELTKRVQEQAEPEKKR